MQGTNLVFTGSQQQLSVWCACVSIAGICSCKICRILHACPRWWPWCVRVCLCAIWGEMITYPFYRWLRVDLQIIFWFSLSWTFITLPECWKGVAKPFWIDLWDGQVTELPFFATRVKLGKKGLEAIVSGDLTGLTDYEQNALEALKSELKGSIEKGVSFASNGATVAVWSKLTQLFLQALLEATVLLQVQLVVKRRSNMEQENINWLFFLPEFRHFFDFRANHEACWNFVQILSKVIISANCTCSGIHQKHEAFICAVSVLMINNLLSFSVLSTVLLRIL